MVPRTGLHTDRTEAAQTPRRETVTMAGRFTSCSAALWATYSPWTPPPPIFRGNAKSNALQRLQSGSSFWQVADVMASLARLHFGIFDTRALWRRREVFGRFPRPVTELSGSTNRVITLVEEQEGSQLLEAGAAVGVRTLGSSMPTVLVRVPHVVKGIAL